MRACADGEVDGGHADGVKSELPYRTRISRCSGR